MRDLSSTVTVVCASAGVFDALDLMWASFVHFHGQAPLFVYANSPETRKARTKPAKYVDGPSTSHGVALDRLGALVETPFVLVTDDDVCFEGPLVGDMLEAGWARSAFCVCPPRRFPLGTLRCVDNFTGQVECAGQERIDPCCALFRTKELLKLLEHFSFACYQSAQQAKHWDTGGMIYQAARAMGHTILTPEWIWEGLHHFGCVSWGLWAPVGTPEREHAEKQLQEIRARLAIYREEEDQRELAREHGVAV